MHLWPPSGPRPAEATMSTVLVDRYRVTCSNCGFDQEFIVGAGRGDLFAVKDAERFHAQGALHCDSEIDLTVTKREVVMTPTSGQRSGA